VRTIGSAGEFFGEPARLAAGVWFGSVLLAVGTRGDAQLIDPRTGDKLRGEVSSVNALSIGRDLDGDGTLDSLRAPAEGDTELVVIRGVAGAELQRLRLDNPRDRLFRLSTLAVDVDGDGRNDLAVVWPNFRAGTSSIHLYFGSELQSHRSIALGSPEAPFNDIDGLRRDLYTCGDLNGDGCEDVLAAKTAFCEESLTCYSGADGSTLWVTPEVVESQFTSIDRLRDVDEDGVNEVLCGKVLYLTMGVQYGNVGTAFEGNVFVLSGKSGRILHQFIESQYPGISLEHYLAQQRK
jgi:hypothetical protein